MDTQKDIIKAWVKVEKNSLYGNIPPSNSFMFYDEKLSIDITKEAQNKLNLIHEILKGYL